jgi:hypothetical protein
MLQAWIQRCTGEYTAKEWTAVVITLVTIAGGIIVHRRVEADWSVTAAAAIFALGTFLTGWLLSHRVEARGALLAGTGVLLAVMFFPALLGSVYWPHTLSNLGTYAVLFTFILGTSVRHESGQSVLAGAFALALALIVLIFLS